MKSLDQAIEDLRLDSARALAEHPDRAPLDPLVSYEQAMREWYQYCDATNGQVLDKPIQFRIGQHVARVTLCAALEATAQFLVSREQRVAAFLAFHERSRAIHKTVGVALGYDGYDGYDVGGSAP